MAKVKTTEAPDSHRLESIFKKLGFRKHAAEIYLTLLKHGPMIPTSIISHSQTSRPAVYRSLHDMLKAGILIKQKKGKKFYWNALPPKRIEELFSKEATSVSKTAETLPYQNISTEIVNDTLRILKGREGIREVFDDTIDHMDKGGTFYRYTSETDLDAVNAYLSKDYRKRRDAKKLERRVISNPFSGKRKSPRLERFIRFIPPEASLFTQNVIQLIYKDRIAFIDLNKEEALIIENRSLADFQTVIFKQLYKKL